MRLDTSFTLHLISTTYYEDVGKILRDIEVQYLPSGVMFGPQTTSEECSSGSAISDPEETPSLQSVSQGLHSVIFRLEKDANVINQR